MTGSPSQIEWAERIKQRVGAEFDRVVNAFERAAASQSGQDRIDTHAIIAIASAKRAEVMANQRAGYFIHDWQELSDQVRQMIRRDPAWQAIRQSREARSGDQQSRAE